MRTKLPPPEWLRDARMGMAEVTGDALLFLSNSDFTQPALDTAAAHVYSVTQATQNYSGAPARIVQLARSHSTGNGDRGHCLSLCPDGTLLMATTERVGDPSNNTESLYVVPPGLAGELTAEDVRRVTFQEFFGASPPVGFVGMRIVCQMGDGTAVLGGGNYCRLPLPTLLDFDSDLTGVAATRWWADGAHGELPDQFDCARDPRDPDLVWIPSYDRVWCYRFTPGTTGLVRSERMAQGSNIGDPNDGGWPGGIAFGRDGLWKTRSHTSDAIMLSWSQLDALPNAIGQANGNPTPARTLTCTDWAAINTNFEGLVCVDFDAQGGAWFSSTWWVGQDVQTARAWHFSAAAMTAGGTQQPDRVLTNVIHRPISLRLARAFRLHER